MECIEFKYCFKDGDNDCKEVKVIKRNEDGLCSTDICEMFVDFMESVGFSTGNVFNYFQA